MAETAAPPPRYVAGFLMDDHDRVVVVRKLRPRWQAGLLNGVGGKVEDGETPHEAMRREFREEAGLDLEGWERFAVVVFDHCDVTFFRAFTTPDVLETVSSCTDEPIEVHQISGLLAAGSGVVANLRWLLPLGAYRAGRLDVVVARER